MMIGSLGLLVVFTSTVFLQASHKKPGCQFPASWQGIWFQQGVRPYITIDEGSISGKGRCYKIEGGHVMVARTGVGGEDCFSCLVVHPTHTNIIHYKQTLSCLSSPSADLSSMCRTIPGDAPLFTLFRVDATSIRCPIQGPKHFSYNFGRGLCQSPMSSLESCTIDTRISLKYQACPTVPGTEMKDMQFECLASWREGRNNFLVVKMEHGHISKDEERFRCILWETDGARIPLDPYGFVPDNIRMTPLHQDNDSTDVTTYMSLSGDASCNGLYSSKEGQTMVLHPVGNDELCSLPGWVRSGRQWQSLDTKLKIEITQDQNTNMAKMSVLRGESKIAGTRYYKTVETSVMACHSVKSIQEDLVRLVMHETRGCTTGYVCTEMIKLDDTVMELRMGKMSITKEYACDKEYFNASTPTFTLVGGPSSKCPLHGVFSVDIKHSDFSLAVKPDTERVGGGVRMSHQTAHVSCTLPYSIQLGCSQHDRRDMVWSACHSGLAEISSHQCVTAWTDSNTGVNYFVSKVVSRNTFACYSYTLVGNLKVVKMLGTQCKTGDINSFPFNITKIGDCDSLNAGERFLLRVSIAAISVTMTLMSS